MRLIALELENFRQYAKAQIQFSTGITAIVGANGAGKSTLLEAILWALYGARALREGTDTVRFLWSQGGSQVRVVLEFELGGRRYQVSRTLKDAMLAHHTQNGWTPLARGTSSVNDAVPKLLGMNLLQFQTSFCARQKELEFMSYAPEKRREEISRMLGYERIRTVLDNLTQRTRALDAEVSGLMQGIGDTTALEAQAEHAQQELQHHQQALQQLDAQLEQARQTEAHAQLQLETQQARRQTYQSLLQQKALLERDQANLVEQEQHLRQRWQEMQEAKKRLTELKPQAERYRELVKQLRTLDELAQHEHQRVQLTAQRQSLEQQLEALQQQQDELLQKRAQLESLQSPLNELKQAEVKLREVRQRAQQAQKRAQLETEIQHLDHQIDQLKAQETQHAQLQSQIEQQESALRQLRKEREAKENALHQVRERWHAARAEAQAALHAAELTRDQLLQRLEQLESLGEATECPTCGQPLGDAYEEVLQHVRQELENAERECAQQRQQVQKLAKEPSELIRAQNELQQLQQKWDAENQKLAQLKQQAHHLKQELQRLKALETLRQQIEAELQDIPTYDPQEEQALLQQIESLKPVQSQAQQLEGELKRLPQIEREISQRTREIARLSQQLESLPTGYDPQRHEEVRNELQQLQPVYEEALQLHTLLKDYDPLKEQIATLRARKEENAQQLQQVETQLRALNYSEEDYQHAEAAYQQARSQREALERQRHEHLSQADALQRLIENLHQQIEQARARKRQMEQKQREAAFYRTLRTAMQDFQKELNTRLRPMLAGYASEFLASLTNGRYSQIEIDEQFRFYLIDDGIRKTVISGGEEDVVNLSLRLALARLITERAGQPLSLLILDEVFGSLDTERRASVLNLLNTLRDWFEQILVISHIEDINESAERCLYVVRDERTRTSQVFEKLDGAAPIEVVAPLSETSQPAPTLFEG